MAADSSEDSSMQDSPIDTIGDPRDLGDLSWQWREEGSAGRGGTKKRIHTWTEVVNGQIVDRIVVKDELDLSDYQESCWDSATITGRDLPTEITTMLLVRNRTGSDKIVKLRNWRVDNAATAPGTRPTKYRLYLEYCGFGNMTNLYVAQPNVVPEPLLWKVFHDLVTACIVLERGDVDPGGASWNEIVHRDLKMENVFLGDPGETFRGYPTAKLGDFGAAMIVPLNDTRTHTQLNHYEVGTMYNQPPEQIKDLLNGTAIPQRMSSKSNVWGVGLCLWGLVQNRIDLAETGDSGLEPPDDGGLLDPDDAFPADHREPFGFDETAEASYTNNLLELIMHCVQYLPDDRPTLDELQKRVELGLSAHTEGLRDVDPQNSVWDDLLPNYAKDKYALFSAARSGEYGGEAEGEGDEPGGDVVMEDDRGEDEESEEEESEEEESEEEESEEEENEEEESEDEESEDEESEDDL